MRRRLMVVAITAVMVGTAGMPGLQAATAPAANRQASMTETAPRSPEVHRLTVTAAVDGCQIASAYPEGYPVCGYEQDGPWLFPSTRSVTCWAGIQYRPDHNYRYWAKCHAKGVHGTIVDARYSFQDADVDLYTGSPYGFHSHVALGCPTTRGGCPKTGKDVYWVGQWRAHPGSPYGITFQADIKAEIVGTQDRTSWHCVPSEVWFFTEYNNGSPPGCPPAGHPR
jgi:hypothetical protein